MSGIVALFFSAICHAHYSYYSVAPESQTALKRFFEFAAFLSETFVFAYLGLQASDLETEAWIDVWPVSNDVCACHSVHCADRAGLLGAW